MFLVNSFLGPRASRSRARAGVSTDGTDGAVGGGSEAVISYTPQPPPLPTHYSRFRSRECEEILLFRLQFERLAGLKMEVSAGELMGILNRALARLKSGRLGIHTCENLLAVMDSETNGKLGFEEFKYLWNNIKKWQAVYKEHTSPRSRILSSQELPRAFVAAGFQLSQQLYDMVVRRYSDDGGAMAFEDFICCLVRLDAMFRAFKSLEKDGSGYISLNAEEWLQMTMYS
ncbi:calpain small subunit 1-like [Trichosurus vulpecula]|uniref:calpain small subunit 1-like n=1 Tax=Trichosurus vulpecula TaxID=9337 RepID=UPI00186B5010|nr:calpain small subunit 1-like [Trichosurus vulpecula]